LGSRTNLVTATFFSSELAKLAANTFLAQRISSVNAMSAVCEETGADIDQVAKAVGMDPRLGPHFLQASVGFGGSCFKKDILGLVYLCETYKLTEVASYFRHIVLINEHQKERFSRQIVQALFGTVKGKKICLLGFAFKKNTGDIRESPAIDVAHFLLEEGARVVVYDPKVRLEEIHELGPQHAKIVAEKDPYTAVYESHAVVVLTEWDEFKTIDYKKVYDLMRKPAFIFDGRNILDHTKLSQLGFVVHAIGKPHFFRQKPKL